MNEFEQKIEIIVDRLRHMKDQSFDALFTIQAIYADGREEFEFADKYSGIDQFRSCLKKAQDSGASKIEVSLYKTKGSTKPTLFTLTCPGGEPVATTKPHDEIRDMIAQTLGALREEQQQNNEQLTEIQKLTLGSIKQGYMDQLTAMQHDLAIKDLKAEIDKKQQEINELEEDYRELEKLNEELTQKVLKSKRVEDMTSTIMTIGEAALRMKPSLIPALEPFGLSGLAQALVANSPASPSAEIEPSPNTGVSSVSFSEGAIPQMEGIVRYFKSLNDEDKQRFYDVVVALEDGKAIGLLQLHQTLFKS